VKKEKKSLRSRPGAMKKKEMVERMERERFKKNMALMIAGTATQAAHGSSMASDGGLTTQNATNGRWAAIQAHIKQTMDQKEEFKKP
jgi:hypothetical protein